MYFSIKKLNEEQRKAVEAPLDQAILVLAGAGTGKTKTLTHRIAYLIKEHNLSPQQILALTFTNKAAREMEDRLKDMIPSLVFSFDQRIARTFHSLSVSVLREQYQAVGIHKYFRILDENDSRALIREALSFHSLSSKEWDPRKILSFISKKKSELQTKESLSSSQNPFFQVVKKVWTSYDEIKKEQNALDFDDLLYFIFSLFKEREDILQYYQKKWKYILVDEYQDTNRVQYEILRLLLGKGNHIFAVGDADQNIYSWRGADLRNILSFEKDFAPVLVFFLEQNYRSREPILNAAQKIIEKNRERKKKNLFSSKKGGEKIDFFLAFDERSEAQWIVERVNSLIKSGISPDEIAILFRTNAQSRVLEEMFLHYGIPYTLLGIKFFARKEVKDLLSYLRLALNPKSREDLKRVINLPKRGIGKISLAKIFSGREDELPLKAKESYQKFLHFLSKISHNAKKMKLSDLLRFILEESGLIQMYELEGESGLERIENMKELISYATKFDEEENAIELFFEEISLLSDQDSFEKNEEKVKLMTIHASKGLEFSHVFISGMEQGLFPANRDDALSSYEREEERRLCYVAFTRAKEKLFLSAAKKRMIYGQNYINEVSEFVFDIPKDLLFFDGDFDTDFSSEEEWYIDDEGKERRSYLNF